jgi:hypothetical protein
VSFQLNVNWSVLTLVDFLDHLLRETPSKTLHAVKRSYFGRTTQEREMIGRAVEAMKGVYQSIRAAQVRDQLSPVLAFIDRCPGETFGY